MTTLLNTHGVRRDAILAALAQLPPGTKRMRARLELVTREFLKSPFFADAMHFGWTDEELFGVHPIAPMVRVDQLGIVSGLAISRLAGPRLERIGPDAAIVRCSSGSRLSAPRTRQGESAGIPWWTCSLLNELPLAVEDTGRCAA
jgi:hypothetical protein